jgi:phasin family protein
MFPMNDQITSMLKSFQPNNEQFTNALKNMFQGINQFPSASQNRFFGNEQFASAVKASVETQVAFYNTLHTSSVAAIEKLLELNMSTAKVTTEESAVICKQLISSQDAKEVQAILGALPQSILAKATAYSSHIANIGSASQTELTRAAEQQFADMGARLTSLIDQASKGMPIGSENPATTAKAVIAGASAGYEQFNKTAQQAGEAVAAQASNAAEKVSELAAQAVKAGTQVA